MVSDQDHPGRQGLRTVLLRHVLPDGSWHFDWMLELRRGGSLATFRLGVRPDDPAVADFHGERIGDHRSTYLEYEGEVGGGRGRVERVAAGEVDLLFSSEDAIDVVLRIAGLARQWRGSLVSGAIWRFHTTPDVPAR
jgi:hypothetical protein